MIRPTSSWANRSRSPLTRKQQRERIVQRLKFHGPMTREALESWTLIPGNSLRSAVIDCMRSGSVRVVPGKYGKTKAGNKAELLAAAKGVKS